MKGYVIHLPKSKLSVDIATETKKDLESLGIEISLFNGCDKYDVWQEFIDGNFKINDITRFGGGFVDSEIATFISHYRLWNKCIELDTPIFIFEHDVELRYYSDNYFLKDIESFDEDLLNLGSPNWGTRIWEGNGIEKREHHKHKEAKWLYGAHAYYLSPRGAHQLVNDVKKRGILPADLFIRQGVVNIFDLLPHPFKQKKTFSLIQRHPIYKNQRVDDWDY